MNIVMLEPLGVDKEVIDRLSKPFMDKGHRFTPCFEKINNKDEIIKRASEADILIIANSPLDGDVIEACPNLKMISVAFTGIDHIDIKTCKEKNILISNAAGYCTDAVAELTFGLILNLLRNIKDCDNATRDGKTKSGFIGNELFNKTIGIIGTGAIGFKVAKVARAFDCKVLAHSRTEKKEVIDLGVEYVSLEKLLKESDIVTIHTPLTNKTKNLIDKEKLDLMKPSSILINVARGPVVDSEALAKALNDENIAGAGIDVYEMEPPIPRDHPLLSAKNMILTPHVAFATHESIERRATITFENISAWMENKPQNIMLK
ncbi:NAD(P)-dependent oxidoreductase [Dethiothermospora halolimnae]|uniref:NAD(P)-dependent oxidoreductase n=1 Tax=Dethiothermospora halolimnae TaxID=3114390 RepID=UPI003CCC38CC